MIFRRGVVPKERVRIVEDGSDCRAVVCVGAWRSRTREGGARGQERREGRFLEQFAVTYIWGFSTGQLVQRTSSSPAQVSEMRVTLALRLHV